MLDGDLAAVTLTTNAVVISVPGQLIDSVLEFLNIINTQAMQLKAENLRKREQAKFHPDEAMLAAPITHNWTLYLWSCLTILCRDIKLQVGLYLG